MIVQINDQLNLYLQRGHKYLFSDTALSWQDARAECALYGGWLVNIQTVEEQNCLVRHGRSQGLDTWYLTDGGISLSLSQRSRIYLS